LWPKLPRSYVTTVSRYYNHQACYFRYSAIRQMTASKPHI